MNATAAVEALKALHVPTQFSYGFKSPRTGCRLCGQYRPYNRQVWPCETREILDRVEAHEHAPAG